MGVAGKFLKPLTKACKLMLGPLISDLIFYLSWTPSSNNLLLPKHKQAESFYAARSHYPTPVYA